MWIANPAWDWEYATCAHSIIPIIDGRDPSWSRVPAKDGRLKMSSELTTWWERLRWGQPSRP